MEMESGNGGREGRQQLLPFRRKPESLRRSRIRRRRPLQCSASRKILAVARMRFRLSPEWKILFFAARFSSFPFPPLFHSREGGNLFPRQRELPRSGMVACRRMRLSPQRFLPLQEWKGGREWKGRAGMERGSGIENGSGMEVRVGGNERRAGMEAGAGIAFIIR